MAIKNKPPAFQFYPKDFISDMNVMMMTNEEVGVYIKTLCHIWLEINIPDDSGKIQRLCNHPSTTLTTKDKAWEKIWSAVRPCFYDKNGKLYHKRLDKERRKQDEWRKKSRQGGQASAERRRLERGEQVDKKDSRVVEPPFVPNTNSSVFGFQSSSSIPNKKEEKNNTKKNAPNPIDIELTQFLIDKILENDVRSSGVQKMTEENQRSWMDDCRKIREIDKRTPDEIKAIIEWCQKDNFWRANILSMASLRKQFDKLYLQAKRNSGKSDFSGIQEWLKEMSESNG